MWYGTLESSISLQGSQGSVELAKPGSNAPNITFDPDPGDVSITGSEAGGSIDLLGDEGDEGTRITADAEAADVRSRVRLSERDFGGVSVHTTQPNDSSPGAPYPAGVAELYDEEANKGVEIRGNTSSMTLGYSDVSFTEGEAGIDMPVSGGRGGKLFLDDGNTSVIADRSTAFQIRAFEGKLEIATTDSGQAALTINANDRFVEIPSGWVLKAGGKTSWRNESSTRRRVAAATEDGMNLGSSGGDASVGPTVILGLAVVLGGFAPGVMGGVQAVGLAAAGPADGVADHSPSPGLQDHAGASGPDGASISGIEIAGTVARCSLSETEIDPGESVTLDATAWENVTAYRYDKFGDGSFGEWMDTGTRTYTYEDPGTYDLQIQTRSSDDTTDTASCGSLTVSENQQLSADFTYEPPQPDPLGTVSFTSLSSDSDGDIVSYEWRVDGQLVAEGSSIEYTFETAGDHLVELTVTDDGATDTASETVVVEANQPPSADFSNSPAEPRPGDAVSFTSEWTDDDGQIVSSRWDVDGQTVSERETFQYTFNVVGEHLVELTVTDDDGATAIESATVAVESANQAPAVTLSFAPSEPEPDTQVTFTANATDEDGEVVGYEWTVDGETVVSSPDSEFGYVFEQAGEHLVEVVAEDDDGATARANRTVTVTERNQPPTVNLSYSPEEPTTGETVTVGRMLDDFIERGWIERSDEGFVASYYGTAIAKDAATLERTLETVDRLQPVCEYLDTHLLDFDPRLLGHGTISRGPAFWPERKRKEGV